MTNLGKKIKAYLRRLTKKLSQKKTLNSDKKPKSMIVSDDIKPKIGLNQQTDIKNTDSTNLVPSKMSSKNFSQQPDSLSNPDYVSNNTNSNNPNNVTLTPAIISILEKNDWKYTHYPPKNDDNKNTHSLLLGMRHKELEWNCLVRIQEDTNFVALYGILPDKIPESHKSAALLLITQVNYGLMIGNIDMDLKDGEVRFKISMDMENVIVNEKVVMPLFQSIISMTHVTHQIVQDLLAQDDPSDDIEDLLHRLKEQHQSPKQFFMPSNEIQ